MHNDTSSSKILGTLLANQSTSIAITVSQVQDSILSPLGDLSKKIWMMERVSPNEPNTKAKELVAHLQNAVRGLVHLPHLGAEEQKVVSPSVKPAVAQTVDPEESASHSLRI
jgi:hypothetical protein